MVSTEKKHKFDLVDFVIWAGIIIIFLWAIGKSIGWISSPVWVDMIPVFCGGATVAGISVKIGRLLQKIDVVIGDVDKIKDELKTVDRRLAVLEHESNVSQ